MSGSTWKRRGRHRHAAIRVTACIWILISQFTLPSNSAAQFLYLDTNGDGRSSSSDVLNGPGVPTIVTICLDTARNADSSVAYCTTGAEPLTINSYEFVLHASGGTVAFTDYVNLQAPMPLRNAVRSNATDFYAGFGSFYYVRAGRYQLGSVSVTVETGAPSLNPASSTLLDPSFGTSFGSECAGTYADHTYRLGLDWHGIAGCGPPQGGNAAPAAAAPRQVTIETGVPAEIAAEFVDFNSGDSLSVDVQGSPIGFHAVRGEQWNGRRQLRLYGSLPPGTPSGTSFGLTWVAGDGTSTDTARTTVTASGRNPSPAELESRVVRLVTGHYIHGMSQLAARALGTSALPQLARMLRDEQYKHYWAQIAQAIGNIGDTAYFDTLHAFIWERFHGPIDQPTSRAIEIAQANLYAMASVSPRALDYLIATSTPEAWSSVPWTWPGETPDRVANIMVQHTLGALCWTDSDRPRQVFDALPPPMETQTLVGKTQRMFIESLRETHTRVREVGFVRLWVERRRLPPQEGE